MESRAGGRSALWGGWILAVFMLLLSPLVWVWVAFATLPCRPEDSALGRLPFLLSTLQSVLVLATGPHLLVRRGGPRWRRWAWAPALLAASNLVYGCLGMLKDTFEGRPPVGWCF